MSFPETTLAPILTGPINEMSNVAFLAVRISDIEGFFALPEAEQQFFTAPERERLSRFSLPKRRSEWMAGRYVLKTLVQAEAIHRRNLNIPFSGFSVVSEGELPRLIPAPKLAAPAADFLESLHSSISHGAGLAAAIMGPIPVGIDVEAHRILEDRLVKRFLNDEETRLTPHEETIALWTVKEAVCKAHGQGFGVGDLLKIRIPEFAFETLFLASIPSAGACYNCFTVKKDSWRISLATHQPSSGSTSMLSR